MARYPQRSQNLAMHGILPYMARMATTSRTESKRERMELRVARSAKQLIQRAMAVSGLTAGDLAYEGARRILDEHERMTLAGADREAFLDAVRAPHKPPRKLVQAFKRHRERVG